VENFLLSKHNDAKKDGDEEDNKKEIENLLNSILENQEEEDDCGSCKI
jgi:hypothetical protein